MTQEVPTPLPCKVVILTVLLVEHQVMFHSLQKPLEVVAPSGTIYHRIAFPRNIESGAWR